MHFWTLVLGSWRGRYMSLCQRNGAYHILSTGERLQINHCGVDLTLCENRFGESSDDTGIVDGIGAGEEAALAVFEPLGKDLVTADLVGPELGGDPVEVLGGVDADAPTVGVV